MNSYLKILMTFWTFSVFCSDTPIEQQKLLEVQHRAAEQVAEKEARRMLACERFEREKNHQAEEKKEIDFMITKALKISKNEGLPERAIEIYRKLVEKR